MQLRTLTLYAIIALDASRTPSYTYFANAPNAATVVAQLSALWHAVRSNLGGGGGGEGGGGGGGAAGFPQVLTLPTKATAKALRGLCLQPLVAAIHRDSSPLLGRPSYPFPCIVSTGLARRAAEHFTLEIIRSGSW